MSTLFFTYLWHYLAARGIYDQVFAPIAHGHPAALVLITLTAVIGFVLGRRSGRRRTR